MTVLLILLVFPQSSYTSEQIDTEEKEPFVLIVNEQSELVNVYANDNGEAMLDVLDNNSLVERADHRSEEENNEAVGLYAAQHSYQLYRK